MTIDQVALATVLVALCGVVFHAGRMAERVTQARADIDAIWNAIRAQNTKLDHLTELVNQLGPPR
ncbi:MAG: hypothetical protein ACRD1V_17885 [Vicinamibacterales bacterium]